MGVASASCCVPPDNSIRPFAIFVGKKPGAIALQRIPCGASSTAKLRVMCRAAAFEALYANVAFSPSDPMPIPATEAVTTTREGSEREARLRRRGANLDCSVSRLRC